MYGGQLYKVDKDGFPTEIVIVYYDENGNLISEVDEDVIKVVMPQGLYRPRWNGSEWEEGLTQEEIDELNKPSETEPSFEELQLEYNIDLDYRLSIIEMGLV